jgi:cobalt-zinc-cadmium efflux system outer membrane protein
MSKQQFQSCDAGRALRGGVLAAITILGFSVAAADERTSPEPAQLETLIAEAVEKNPEIAASRAELLAAQSRIAPAGALDNPMLEAGVISVPVGSLSLTREEMTMQMLGVSQRLPFPGKRELRRQVARAEAVSVELGLEETINRLVRDLRTVWEELVFNAESQRIIERTRVELRALAQLTGARYDVGQAMQTDVLEAQTEYERLRSDQLALERDQAALRSELRRLLGRKEDLQLAVPEPRLVDSSATREQLHESALERRPQLLGLQALADQAARSVELARRDYYPDFDVRLQYGLRDRAPDGMERDDMVSLVVAVDLPLWRKSKLEPLVAESRAMRGRATQMLEAERLATIAELDTQLAELRKWRSTAALYENTLLPQARAAVSSAFAAYRVGGVDFATLRQAQLRALEATLDHAEAIANHNKAAAEIDLLVGTPIRSQP